ncbi:MAG: ADP-ribosylation factor-like protein [Promethearchaeota archaeon]|jgi:GTPase SAR1 family protein
MLRQIHIFYDKEHVFVKDFAKAFGNEELNKVLETIKKYMDVPIPGKIMNRKISDLQIFHRGQDSLYFLFVTDLVDSLKYVEKIMDDSSTKFHELFPDPTKIKAPSASKEKFLSFLDQIQRDLQSKISIVGPSDAGKTTLYNLLRSEEETTVMDFAKFSNFNIDDLRFELWDFQLKDNFSLLWTKFIHGSDLVILIFNLGNFHLKTIKHFLNLFKIEGNQSKLLIIGNKRDLVKDRAIKRIKNELGIQNFIEISLNSPDAKSQVQLLIKETIGLIEELPPNFEDMVREAESLVNVGNTIQALAKYKEIVQICALYRDFEHSKIYQAKVDEINEKLREQMERRKEIEKTVDFGVPKQLKFKKKISVKPLPDSIPSIESLAQEKSDLLTQPPFAEESPKKLVSFQKLESKPAELKVVKTTEIPPRPKKSMPSITKDEKTKIKGAKMPMELFGPHEGLTKDIKKSKVSDYTNELQKIITEKGGSLSLNLCEQLIRDLEQSLGRTLTIEDVELAADFFVKQEQLI